jgi:hypothetical protein
MNNHDEQYDAHVSTKEKFDLGMAMLKSYYEGLENRVERTALILVGVVGWLITSAPARESVANSGALFVSAVTGLTVLLLMAWGNISHFLSRFREIQKTVEDLKYVNPAYFTRYRMPTQIRKIPTLYIYFTPLLVLYILLLAMLLQIRFHQ